MISLQEGPQVMAALPRYQCHKKVWALKIKSIVKHYPTVDKLQMILDGGKESPAATITPEDVGYDSFGVSQEYMLKHNPEVGGYWVQYEDGYESYSPRKAFEEGYTRING